MPWVGLQFVIVVFSDHTQILFYNLEAILDGNHGKHLWNENTTVYAFMPNISQNMMFTKIVEPNEMSKSHLVTFHLVLLFMQT